MKRFLKEEGSSPAWKSNINKAVFKQTKSENFVILSFINSGLVSLYEPEKVIIRIAFFCNLNKELVVEVSVLPQAIMPYGK